MTKIINSNELGPSGNKEGRKFLFGDEEVMVGLLGAKILGWV